MNNRIVRSALIPLVLGLVFPVLAQGQPEIQWSRSSFGTDDYFREPSDIEVDRRASLIYVVDAGSCRVLVFDFKGDFRRVIGSKGQGPGEFTRPTGACLLPEGGLAVADPGANRIQVFDADGKFVRGVNVTGPRVADLVVAAGLYYTVPSHGQSGFAVVMGETGDNQPLVNVLDADGRRVAEIATDAFPESHPFVRAIKHRVCLALGPDGRLYLPYFAAALVQVFERSGKMVSAWSRPLPFKPRTPVLAGETSPEKGVVQMRAELDFVSLAAAFGPDGKLDILTVTEGLEAVRKKNPRLEDPLPMRIDVVDPAGGRLLRSLPCEPGIKTFGLMDGTRLAYICEDAEGELALKCVKY
jgi:hypothetical protein